MAGLTTRTKTSRTGVVFAGQRTYEQLRDHLPFNEFDICSIDPKDLL
jgi:hypothetical protein